MPKQDKSKGSKSQHKRIRKQVASKTVIGKEQSQNQLRHKEEFFEALIENAMEAMVIIGGDGAIRYKSPSIERVFGYKMGDDIGRSSFDFVHPADISNGSRTFEELLKKPGSTVHYEIRAKHADGSWHTIAVVGKNLLDNPAIKGIVANFRDITEQKRMQEELKFSEEHFRALIENSLEAMAIINSEGLLTFLSPSFERLLGYKLEETMSQSPFAFVHADDLPRVSGIFGDIAQRPGAIARTELRVWHKDGSLRIVEVVGQNLLNNPAVNGIVANVRDTTERRQAEETLKHMYQQERELRQQLEQEMKKRVEFTRVIAHELKTPLTSLLASSDLLASEIDTEPLQTLARNIRQGASSLDSRINELLDLVRGEVGMLALKPEMVDLSQMLRDIADSMKPVALKRGQSLDLSLTPGLPVVRADPAKLRQIVTNLLDNALKFTPQGGNIRLGARRKDNDIVVEVRDTGRGMSKEEQQFLFQPHQLPRGESSEGLGLGLALCKMLVELHGGKIWVKSSVGRGSTFGFSLPLESADRHEIEPKEPAKLWKVLIIEDDNAIVNFVRLAFKMRWPEAELLSARLGEEGLDLIESEKPDLVILDLGLPDIDGFEVLRQIRLFSSVPVVILTVSGEEADMVKGLELGADDYIVKPFRQMEFLARLKSQLRRKVSPDEEAPIACGPLRLDPSTFELTYRGKQISLTLIEGRIMCHLMQNAGHVVTHSRLGEVIWGEDYPGAVDSLRVYIRHLREKLETDPGNPQFILTKVGVGYLLAKLND
ncbi:MAG: PAS domain S-box protein [Chloroflexi bacterium]|nr:PAS domain S-box protein [Chloroflexota bacterium]